MTYALKGSIGMLKQLKFAIIAAVTAILVSCGGGDASDTAQGPLAKYIGTWIGCADNERRTIKIQLASQSTLTYHQTNEDFDDPNCAGSSVGTFTLLPDPIATLTFQNTETILVEDPQSYPVSLVGNQLVDRFRFSSLGGTITITGSKVVGDCVIYQGGRRCTRGGNPAVSPPFSVDYALHLAGSTLTLIRNDSGKFVPEEVTLTKQ